MGPVGILHGPDQRVQVAYRGVIRQEIQDPLGYFTSADVLVKLLNPLGEPGESFPVGPFALPPGAEQPLSQSLMLPYHGLMPLGFQYRVDQIVAGTADPREPAPGETRRRPPGPPVFGRYPAQPLPRLYGQGLADLKQVPVPGFGGEHRAEPVMKEGQSGPGGQ